MATKRSLSFGGVEVLFGMRGPCNYSCDYCIAQYGPHEKKPALYDLAWLKWFYDSLAEIDGPDPFVVSSFECANSEPTVHPQIRGILDTLTRFGAVSFPSNNSIAPSKWLPDHPERLSLRLALHPQGEEDLQGFVERALELQKAGVDVTVIYVLHPTRLERAKAHIDRFGEVGLNFLPQAFHGEHRGKHYPSEHNRAERELLRADEPGTYWYHRLHLAVTVRNFKGIPCVAGWRSLHVSPPNVLRRCTHVATPLRAPLDHATPCPVDKCGTCGLWLEELNTLTPWFFNGWRRLAGWPGIEVPPLDNDREYRERLRIYRRLMRKHGKE